MSEKITSIAVLGLGGVGELAARLLRSSGFTVTGVDLKAPAGLPFAVEEASVTDADALGKVLGRQDAVLSCLPYHLNKDVARLAASLGIFYFDLTEGVKRAFDAEGLSIPFPQTDVHLHRVDPAA